VNAIVAAADRAASPVVYAEIIVDIIDIDAIATVAANFAPKTIGDRHAAVDVVDLKPVIVTRDTAAEAIVNSNVVIDIAHVDAIVMSPLDTAAKAVVDPNAVIGVRDMNSIPAAGDLAAPAVIDGNETVGIVDANTISTPASYSPAERVIDADVVAAIADFNTGIAPSNRSTKPIENINVVPNVIDIDAVVGISDDRAANTVVHRHMIANTIHMYAVVTAVNLPTETVTDPDVVSNILDFNAVAATRRYMTAEVIADGYIATHMIGINAIIAPADTPAKAV
jgi:hypothetical protein